MTQTYDKYADKVVLPLTIYACPRPDYIKKLSPDELHELLIDAWVAGVTYSLEVIEKEKNDRETHS